MSDSVSMTCHGWKSWRSKGGKKGLKNLFEVSTHEKLNFIFKSNCMESGHPWSHLMLPPKCLDYVYNSSEQTLKFRTLQYCLRHWPFNLFLGGCRGVIITRIVTQRQSFGWVFHGRVDHARHVRDVLQASRNTVFRGLAVAYFPSEHGCLFGDGDKVRRYSDIIFSSAVWGVSPGQR